MSEAAPEVTHAAVPVWSCEFLPGAGEGAVPLDNITVGGKFIWKCHGDIAVAWDQSPPRLVFSKKEEEYSLKILRVTQLNPNDVQLEVTAYKAGEHHPEFVRVLQGEKGFEAAKPAWKVNSVLDPKDKQPQPYGPVGPWNLPLPLWFIIVVILALVLLAYGIFRRMRKLSQRQRMLQEFQLHRTPLLPPHQFFRDARNLRRQLHHVKGPEDLKKISVDLDRDFRLYILRQFQIPALEFSNPDILKDLRKRHRKAFNEGGESLKRTLRELMKLKARASLASADIEQMLRMSIDTTEKLDLGQRGGRP